MDDSSRSRASTRRSAKRQWDIRERIIPGLKEIEGFAGFISSSMRRITAPLRRALGDEGRCGRGRASIRRQA